MTSKPVVRITKYPFNRLKVKSHILLYQFDFPGNEWKTRFETQEELNQLLQKQIDLLKDKLDKAKESAKGGYEEDMKTYDELSEVGTCMVSYFLAGILKWQPGCLWAKPGPQLFMFDPWSVSKYGAYLSPRHLFYPWPFMKYKHG